MKSKVFLLTLLAVLLAACQPASPAELPGGQVVLSPGETVASGDGNITITFLEVLADSRCPADAMCVWQGNVSVLLQVVSGGQTRQVTLTLGELLAGDVNLVTVNGATVSLVDVQPYPLASQHTDPTHYEVTLDIHN
ncbi:MAG TPA: hypothetical protein VJ182_03990 [Anaerolineales bacterium]|nr:hypothetical protein [Anaerolineales bacterium]